MRGVIWTLFVEEVMLDGAVVDSLGFLGLLGLGRCGVEGVVSYLPLVKA